MEELRAKTADGYIEDSSPNAAFAWHQVKPLTLIKAGKNIWQKAHFSQKKRGDEILVSQSIFNAESPPDPEPILDLKVSDPVYHPISEEKNVACLKNWSNSSPGPDGILVSQVKRCPASLLEILRVGTLEDSIDSNGGRQNQSQQLGRPKIAVSYSGPPTICCGAHPPLSAWI
ncbi:hypothetical protein QE152_g4223 [Popillia japonica]|uniref:Uncharacterized protein n=1 Tax=Popillia japonica TaxID=7064 RepID=A0AAW1MWR7_POPJA